MPDGGGASAHHFSISVSMEYAMRGLLRRLPWVLCLVLLPLLLRAQDDTPAPRYVPPDFTISGMNDYYRDMVVITTTCRTPAEVKQLWRLLTENGALVSVISSPGRMLAWVPPEARAAVLGTRIATAQGEVGVLSLASTAAELSAARDKSAGMMAVEENEADQTLAKYLEYIRTPRDAQEIARMEQNALEDWAKSQSEPHPDAPVQYVSRDEGGGKTGVSWTAHANSAMGYVVHASFYLESTSSSGSWNWPSSLYEDYKTHYLNAVNFWAGISAKYGHTMTTYWILYGPSSSVCAVTGEPAVVGEDVFVPIVLDRLLSGSWESTGDARDWAFMYNRYLRDHYSAAEAIHGFTAYKPSGAEGIWPHAWMCGWSSWTMIEGLYYALDTRYDGDDPLSHPLRNVYAHESGHLWGNPDEYNGGVADCDWTYRGMKNVNCQRNRTLPDGTLLRGWDGIMAWNFTAGTSLATPVHSGLQAASAAAPYRYFKTEPVNMQLQVATYGAGPVTFTQTTALACSFDFQMEVTAPPTQVRSGTTYYFDHWTFTRKTGSPTDLTYAGTMLDRYEINSYSSLANPLKEIKAVYTSSPPDFLSVNHSISAWLAPTSHEVSPGRAVALRWTNKYDMSKVETRVEWERTSGNWVEVPAADFFGMAAFNVLAGQWTGVRIYQVPGTSGPQAIQAGTTYRFRIVGYFNGTRGTPSDAAQVTTRPATPADTAFCHDIYEPNGTSSPKTLPSIGPGVDPYAIHAGMTITNISGEFSWHSPKADVYRITAIGLTGGFSGTKLHLVLHVDAGSDFKPILQTQRVGNTTWTNASWNSSEQGYVINIGTDGEYLIKVNADIYAAWGMYDLVDRSSGKFGFGEYTLEVSREATGIYVHPLELARVRVRFPVPVEGILLPDPPFPPELVIPGRGGYNKNAPLHLDLAYIPLPGNRLIEFEGIPFGGTSNPLPLDIGMNTPDGEHLLSPRTEKLPSSVRELVVLNPQGYGEPHANRQAAATGAVVQAAATAPPGYSFVGWGGDTTGTLGPLTTNPLPVTLWKNKLLIAYYRQNPCVQESMTRWAHTLTVRNTLQMEVKLDYGMQAGAGDGLEAGQIDLPPKPPLGTWDVRWVNIVGSQGSTTDVRAIKATHIYSGSVQAAFGTDPITLTWNALPLSSGFTWILKVPSLSLSVNMHETGSVSVPAQQFAFTIEVAEPTCPPPTKPPRVVVTPVRIDPIGFPCFDLELLMRNRKSGETEPFSNPFSARVFEKGADGSLVPMRITRIAQLDSTTLLSICSGREDNDPNREVVVINHEDDPDVIPDTTHIGVKIPTPDGTTELFRIMRQNAGDWEMVSLPVDMADAMTSSLYPDVSTALYSFNPATGGYEEPGVMKFGVGYWLSTTTPTTLFVGKEIKNWVLSGLPGIGTPYGWGWNMIGALSHSFPKASMTVMPSNGLVAMFGWKPGTGYVIPTTIDPGQGYWVRLNPATTLMMASTGVAGGATTDYEKIAARVQNGGVLNVRQRNMQRTLWLSRLGLPADELAALAVPAAPPAPTLDARVGNGSLYLTPGDNTLLLQGEGPTRIELLPVPGALLSCILREQDGRIVHEFDAGSADHCDLVLDGQRTLLLELRMRDPLPAAFALDANYPNPFAAPAQTLIGYEVDAPGTVRLDVYNMLGRHVRTLINQAVPAGRHAIHWDGMDDSGTLAPAGVYMYRLETGGRTLTRTLSIVK
jgi:hypothetical protein